MSDQLVLQRRTCMACGTKEDGYNTFVVPVWSWFGRFMGRWCDWCREMRCWDCGQDHTQCKGTCGQDLTVNLWSMAGSKPAS